MIERSFSCIIGFNGSTGCIKVSFVTSYYAMNSIPFPFVTFDCLFSQDEEPFFLPSKQKALQIWIHSSITVNMLIFNSISLRNHVFKCSGKGISVLYSRAVKIKQILWPRRWQAHDRKSMFRSRVWLPVLPIMGSHTYLSRWHVGRCPLYLVLSTYKKKRPWALWHKFQLTWTSSVDLDYRVLYMYLPSTCVQ